MTTALLEAGAKVIGVSKSIREAAFQNSEFVALTTDIAEPQAAQKSVDEIVARFGRIDILAHLVGGFAGGKTIAETDDATFQSMLNLNLHSAFNVFRAVIPHMRRAKAGRIIAIGSRAAEDPGPGVGAYSASKAALVSLVRTVALENKDLPITANVVLPGTMDTPGNRTAMPKANTAKWVRPANVAALIVWLASEAGRDVNGAAIPVYGRDL